MPDISPEIRLASEPQVRNVNVIQCGKNVHISRQRQNQLKIYATSTKIQPNSPLANANLAANSPKRQPGDISTLMNILTEHASQQ